MVQMASDIERLYIDEEVRDVFLQAYEEDYERKSDLACDVVDCGYLLPPVKCIMDNGDKCYRTSRKCSTRYYCPISTGYKQIFYHRQKYD